MVQASNSVAGIPAGLEVVGYSATLLQTYPIAIICIMGLFAFIFAALSLKLFREFGWVIYKKIGADLQMRRMYRNYQVLIMILKFDGFMLLAFSSQWLMLLNSENKRQQAILHGLVTFIGFPTMLFFVFWAVRTERKWAMWIFFFTDTAAFCYFVVRLILMKPPFSTPDTPCESDAVMDIEPTCDRYIGHRKFLTLFLVVNMLFAIMTLGCAILALRNFNKGLKVHLTREARKGPVGEDLKKRQTVLN